METIQGLAQEQAINQVEILAPTPSVSNPKKHIFDKDETQEKETQKAEQSKEIMDEKVSRLAKAMDNYVQSTQRNLEIQVHEETGDIMVKVVSKDSGKVIREIPPKELLDMAAKLDEFVGILFDEKV